MDENSAYDCDHLDSLDKTYNESSRSSNDVEMDAISNNFQSNVEMNISSTLDANDGIESNNFSHGNIPQVVMTNLQQIVDESPVSDNPLVSNITSPDTTKSYESILDNTKGIDKRRRIQLHPMVDSVTANGREIICKCGRLVRLNPPWYILKYEQHLVSRNCKKDVPTLGIKSNFKWTKDNTIDIDMVLGSGEPPQDADPTLIAEYTCVNALKNEMKCMKISKDGLNIQCTCLQGIKLDVPWCIDRFLQHTKENCLKKLKKLKKSKIIQPKSFIPINQEIQIPCPGIRSKETNEYITTSIQFTGGSRPRHIIAKELFPNLFLKNKKCKINQELSLYEKKLLHDAIEKEAKWWIDKEGNTIRSFLCIGNGILKNEIRMPCIKCNELKLIPSFRTAISYKKSIKNEKNKKYIPKLLFNSFDNLFKNNLNKKLYKKELQELFLLYKNEKNPYYFWLSIAQLGMSNELKEYEIIISILKYIIQLKEKEKRGVGKQNIFYSPLLDKFLNELSIISNDACELFKKHFCGRIKKKKKNKKNKKIIKSIEIINNKKINNNIIEIREKNWEKYILNHPNDIIPCPGLTDLNKYIESTIQLTGGSRPRHIIARELFPNYFPIGKPVTILNKLNENEKYLLYDAIQRETLWWIDKNGKCIRSFKCLRQCKRNENSCYECIHLKRNASFRSAISKSKNKIKNIENIRYIPNQYTKTNLYLFKLTKNNALRNMVFKSDEYLNNNSIFWIQVAKYGINGEFYNYPVFQGLMEWIYDAKERSIRGVGMQNMTYSNSFIHFMNQMLNISKNAFNYFSKKICGGLLNSNFQSKKRKQNQMDSLLFISQDIPISMPPLLLYENEEHLGLIHSQTTYTQELLQDGENDLHTNVINL